MKKIAIVAVLVCQLTAQNAVVRQGSSPSGDVDFSAAKTTKPVRNGATLPTNCTDNELFFLTNVGLHQCVKGKFAALGSGGTWGTVGGAIAAQTDLWSTLQGKQPLLTGQQTQYVRGDGSLGSLAASATTDTTDATKITSGTLPAARLPNPTATTIGGLYAAPATAHQWLSNIDSGGQQHFAQPDAVDLTVAAAGGVQRTQAAKNAEVLSVKDFGATGDGTTDDTAAISRALTTASLAKAKLTIPVGTYIVTATTTRYGTLPAISGVTIAGAGAGSIIKVKSGSGSYFTLFQCGSDCTFRDFTVDMNSTGNPLTTYADTMTYGRFLVAISGINFAMDHVTVKDIDDVNVVYGGVYNSSITNCTFLGIGAGTIAHDHSTLYMAEDKAVIANNLFEGAYVQAPGAGTAIETHGGGVSVTGNVIRNMANGMNITGVTVSDSKNVTVTGNSITGAEYGISLWSMAYTGHTTGYGLDGVVIANNSISIHQSAYAATIGSFGGIDIYPTNNLPVRNIIIRGNSISFDLESTVPDAMNSVTAGISYWDATGTNTFDNVIVESNSITNSPQYAIRFSANGRNLSISRNTIINPGSTMFSVISSYRAGIFLGHPSPISNLRIIGNLITDNLAASRMVYGIASYGANTGDMVYSGNVISATGAATTSLLGAYYLSSASQVPLIQDIVNVPIGSEFPSKKVANGSTIHSLQAGKSYKVASDGVTWTCPQDKIAASTVSYDTLLSSDGVSGYNSISNLLLRSEMFDNSAWQKPGATVTISADATVDPFGGGTADLLTESTGTGTHYIVQAATLAGGVYHFSIYAKQSTRNLGLSISTSYANFDLTSGLVQSTSGGATAAMYSAGNGWYRCDMQTLTLPAGVTNLSVYAANPVIGISYPGDGVSGVYLWGAQISSGPTLAPYVATVGSVMPAQAPTLIARNLYVTNPVPQNILGFTPVPTGDVNSSGVVTKVNGTALAGLATGILKNNTSTGVLSIATAGVDYQAPVAQVLGAYCGGTVLSNATINLLGDLGYPGSGACSSTGVNLAGVPLRAGTMKNMRVHAGTSSVTSGSGIVTVYKNNVLQALTCTLSTSATCADLTNAISIAEGDSVSIRVQSTALSGETLANIFAAAQLF